MNCTFQGDEKTIIQQFWLNSDERNDIYAPENVLVGVEIHHKFSTQITPIRFIGHHCDTDIIIPTNQIHLYNESSSEHNSEQQKETLWETKVPSISPMPPLPATNMEMMILPQNQCERNDANVAPPSTWSGNFPPVAE